MIDEIIGCGWTFVYDLPLFSCNPENVIEPKSDYVLLRGDTLFDISEAFLNQINKCWNKLYERKHKEITQECSNSTVC